MLQTVRTGLVNLGHVEWTLLNKLCTLIARQLKKQRNRIWGQAAKAGLYIGIGTTNLVHSYGNL